MFDALVRKRINAITMTIPSKELARGVLYLFMFSINFEMFDLIGNSSSFSVGRMMGVLYFFSFIISGYQFKLTGLYNILYSLSGMLIVMFVSSVLHMNYISSILLDVSILQNIVLFFLLLNHERRDPGVLEKSLYAFAFGTAVLALLFLLGIGVEYEAGRLILFGDNANAVGIKMSISAFLFIYYIFSSDNRFIKIAKKIAFIVPVPALLLAMLETASRYSYISFILMIILMLVLYTAVSPMSRLPRFLIFLIALIFMIGPFLISNDMIIGRLLAAGEGDLAGRDDIWVSYIPSIINSPFFGYGFSGYEEVSMSIFGRIRSPHNVFIDVLLYGGIVGLMFFIAFNAQVFFSSFYMYLRRKKYLGLVLLFPYLGALFVSHTLTSKIMWFVLAFNCVFLIQKKQILRVG